MTKAVNILLAKVNDTNSSLSYNDVRLFTPQQTINFLQVLIEQDPLPLDRLRNLGDTYNVAISKNSEIMYRWIRLCIRSRDESKLNEALQFVNSQGRMKYVRPIYRDLYAWEAVRERAIENFLKNEPYMMHVSAYTLRKDLHLKD